MELINPGMGLIFWMTLTFLILFILLRVFAWKPILKGLKERENSIESALQLAEQTREEMKNLQAGNEQLLKEALIEKDNIVREARIMKEKMLEDAKSQAQQEAHRIIESAREAINYEKMAAVTELKNQVAMLSIEIAEKILASELDKSKQLELIKKEMSNININ